MFIVAPEPGQKSLRESLDNAQTNKISQDRQTASHFANGLNLQIVNSGQATPENDAARPVKGLSTKIP